MIFTDNMKCAIFTLIANKAKNNADREAYIDLNEININRNEDNALALKDWLKAQDNITTVTNNGHCNYIVVVNEDFINTYSTED